MRRSTIDPDHTIAVFEQLPVFEVIHSSRICVIIVAHLTGNIHRDYIARLSVVEVAEQHGQRVAASFVNLAWRAIYVHDLVHPRLDVLVQIVLDV